MAIEKVAAIVGLGLSAVGTVGELVAQRQAAGANADILAANAAVARRDAAVRERDARREGKRRLASIRAAIGGTGLRSEGSPLFVLSDSAAELELDAQRLRYEGEQEALGFEAERERVLANRPGLFSIAGRLGGLALQGIQLKESLS